MKNICLASSVFIANRLDCLKSNIVDFTKKQEGVTAIEYAVIAVAISGLLMAVFGSGDSSFITAVTQKFNLLTNNIKNTVN